MATRATYTGSTASGVINLAEKASPKVVERFKIGSCTEGLFSHEYDWTGVATVEVRSIDNLPLNDYNSQLATGGSRFGDLTEVGDKVQEMTVQQDKSFNGSIDKRNNNEVLQTKAASKILKRQTDEVLIPYVDKYRLNKLAANAGIGYFLGDTVLSNSNIIEKIMLANAVMSNQKVPDTGRVMYMGYTQAVNLKLADEVVGIDKLGEKSIVNGAMGKVDKCQVRLVPDDYMPAGVLFMIIKTGVALAPKKIETYRVLNNTHIIDGSLVQGRLLHDCFVLAEKNAGVLVCMAAPAAVALDAGISLPYNGTYQLEPKITFISGADPVKVKGLGGEVAYTSAGTSYATVSSTGLITGVTSTTGVNMTCKIGNTSHSATTTVAVAITST